MEPFYYTSHERPRQHMWRQGMSGPLICLPCCMNQDAADPCWVSLVGREIEPDGTVVGSVVCPVPHPDVEPRFHDHIVLVDWPDGVIKTDHPFAVRCGC